MSADDGLQRELDAAISAAKQGDADGLVEWFERMGTKRYAPFCYYFPPQFAALAAQLLQPRHCGRLAHHVLHLTPHWRRDEARTTWLRAAWFGTLSQGLPALLNPTDDLVPLLRLWHWHAP